MAVASRGRGLFISQNCNDVSDWLVIRAQLMSALGHFQSVERLTPWLACLLYPPKRTSTRRDRHFRFRLNAPQQTTSVAAAVRVEHGVGGSEPELGKIPRGRSLLDGGAPPPKRPGGRHCDANHSHTTWPLALDLDQAAASGC